MKLMFPIMALALCAACGGASELDEGGGSIASIHMAGALEQATTKVDVLVLAPRDHDDVIVTCTSLLSGNPLDDRYDVLQSATFTYPPSDSAGITISNVKAKDGAVVYVDAKNATEQVIGEGCEAGVNVKSGSTANVNITIYPSS